MWFLLNTEREQSHPKRAGDHATIYSLSSDALDLVTVGFLARPSDGLTGSQLRDSAGFPPDFPWFPQKGPFTALVVNPQMNNVPSTPYVARRSHDCSETPLGL